MDKWGYRQHNIDYGHAREAGSLSGQLFQQSTADYELAGKTLSQVWRDDTGLHGQIHGTAAGVWFPIQGTAQLIGAGAAYILGY